MSFQTPLKNIPMTHAPSKQQGVMLLEALIGLLIFSIGILALVAMQSVAVAQMRDAQYRNEASRLSERLLTVMTIEGTGNNASTKVTAIKDEVAASLPAGVATITQTASAFGTNVLNVEINIAWQAPGASSTSQHVTAALLNYNP